MWRVASNLLAAGVLGHSLGSLRHCVLGELTRQVEPDSSLDFPAGDGVLLVVVSKPGSFGGDTLEDVVDEGVHDAHGLGRDSSVRVHLLQHLVDVNGVALLAGPLSLLLVPSWLALGGSLLLSLLRGNFARHGESWKLGSVEKYSSSDEKTFVDEWTTAPQLLLYSNS